MDSRVMVTRRMMVMMRSPVQRDDRKQIRTEEGWGIHLVMMTPDR